MRLPSLQVACGGGLELIYEFLQSDEVANRPGLLPVEKSTVKKVAEGLMGGVDRTAYGVWDSMSG